MTSLKHLEAAREAAWRDYDAVQRALPDCEHVRAWKAGIAAARARHQAAIRECDRVRSESAAAPEPVAPRPVPSAGHQGALFGREEAA